MNSKNSNKKYYLDNTNGISKSTFENNKKYSVTSFKLFGNKCSEIKNIDIQEFECLIQDVRTKMNDLTKKSSILYEDDLESYDIEKAIKKGNRILTMHKQLYVEDVNDNTNKILICSEYYEFEQQYNLVKMKLGKGEKND